MALNSSPSPGTGSGPASRTGLFGGSFDPVHRAHLALAQCALAQLGLEQLLWLPAGRPWQKQGRALAEAAQRCAMVELMIADEPRFKLDTSEVGREGPSYTIDTVRQRAAAHPGEQLFLIIGQDQYASLPSWHAWRELLERVTLAVVGRAGQAVQAAPELQAIEHRMVRLEMPALNISSTEVRDKASRGEDIRPMVGNAVAGYIAYHRLYGAPGPSSEN